MKIPKELWHEMSRMLDNDVALLWAETSDKVKWQVLRDLSGSADAVIGPMLHMISDVDVEAWREELGGAEVLRRLDQMYPRKEEKENA